jgi:hypothetical protein
VVVVKFANNSNNYFDMAMPSFSIKMLLDPQIGSHQPITPKFGPQPNLGGFTNLEEVLLSLGKGQRILCKL